MALEEERRLHRGLASLQLELQPCSDWIGGQLEQAQRRMHEVEEQQYGVSFSWAAGSSLDEGRD